GLVPRADRCGIAAVLAQEPDQLTTAPARSLCDHQPVFGARLCAPRLKMQRGGQVMWRVDLYLEFAMGLDQLGNRRDANELSVVDDRDARADLLDLAQHVTGAGTAHARRSEVRKHIAHR